MKKEMLKGGLKYIIVSTITGVVMSCLETSKTTKEGADIAVDSLDNAMFIENPGLSFVVGRSIFDIVEINQDDKDKVSKAIQNNKNPNNFKPAKDKDLIDEIPVKD